METTAAVMIMSALAQPTRLACMQHLAEHGASSAGNLSAALGVPANTMSSHLNILSNAGLVTSSRSGRHIVYQAKPRTIAELIASLAPLAT